MRWNVVELAMNGRYAKLYRGFLLVMEGEQELGRVVIDEMNCLLLTAEQATLSKPLMVKLAEHNVPIVVCGNNYHPISITLAYAHHHRANRILQLQIAASQPLKKRLWQNLVQGKIAQQYHALKDCRPEQEAALKQLQRLEQKVKSGDPDNIEAQAARVYWQALMGKEFRRNAEDSTNAALNYGYTIVRAACARAVMAAGLTPALGLHHRNINNAFCLVDDLMEVFRPVVDAHVWRIKPTGELQTEHKQQLSMLLQADVRVEGKLTTLGGALQKLANSLVNSYANKAIELSLPEWAAE